MASGNALAESGSMLFISTARERSNSPRPGVINGMEQRRFFEARGEESGVWLVLDGKRHPPRVICRCLGWNAPKNAVFIVAALEACNAELYTRFPLDGSARLNEQSAVKPSGEVDSAPEPKPAAQIGRAHV